MKRIIAKLLLVTILAAFALPGNVFAATTLVTVGDICDQWGTVLEKDEKGIMPDATVYIDSTEKYAGNYSAKIVYNSCETPGLHLRLHSRFRNTVNGKRYRIGFMAKAVNASDVRYNIVGVTGGMKKITYDYGANFDWKKIEVEFVSNQPNGSIQFIIAPYAECEAFWVDDVYCYEYSNGEYIGNNLFSNPGFENVSATSPILKEEEGDISQIAANEAVLLTKKDNISVDGNFDEWSDIQFTDITDTYYPLIPTDTAPQTIGGRVGFCYDDDYFYVALDAEDDVHSFMESALWNADGLQAAIVQGSETYGTEVGFYLNDKTGETGTLNMSKQTLAKITRNGNHTLYELGFLWRDYYDEIPEQFKFGICLNDGDQAEATQSGRRGWIELTPGITTTPKNNSQFTMFYTNSDGHDVRMTADESDVIMGNKVPLTLTFLNLSDTQQNYKVKLQGADLDNVIVDSMTSRKVKLSAPVNEIGEHKIAVSVADTLGDYEADLDCVVVGIPDKNSWKPLYNECVKLCEEIKALLDKCEEKGIAADYPRADYTIMEFFTDKIKLEVEKYGVYYRIGEYYPAINEIYSECRQTLEGLLDGSVEDIDVPQIVSSGTYENGYFYANVKEGGKVEKRRVIYIGANTYGTPDEIMEMNTSLGFNTVELGAHLNNILKNEGGKFVEKPKEVAYNEVLAEGWFNVKGLEELLEQCRKDNIGVNLMIGIEVPLIVNETSGKQTMKEANVDYSTFVKANPTHPQYKAQIDVYAAVLSKIIKEYENVVNIIELFNEPSFQTSKTMYYVPFWTEFLVNRYGNDISKLNEAYGTEYKKFTDVNMPDPKKVEYTPLYNDYKDFNEGVFIEFFTYMQEAFKRELKAQGVTKNIPFMVKQLQGIRYTNGDHERLFGTNPEKLADIFEINGTDSHAYINNKGRDIRTRLLWYDMLNSFGKGQSLADTEMHIITDESGLPNNKVVFYDEDIAWTDMNIWQSVIHGLNVINFWRIGNESIGNTGTHSHTNYYNKPREFRSLANVALDAARLTPEIIKFTDAKANVAMLYSDLTYTYRKDFWHSLNEIYRACLYNGQKVFMLGESRLADLDDYDFLIVPHSTNVEEETLDALQRFVDRGGKLVVVGSDSLTRDKYNKPYAKERISAIKSKAVILEAEFISNDSQIMLPADFNETLYGLLSEEGYTDVVVKDFETDERLTEVEWEFVNDGDDMLVNLCNYNMEKTKKVKVYIKGKQVEKLSDIKNMKEFSDGIELKPNEPALLRVSPDDIAK